jgi:hypothetical protein
MEEKALGRGIPRRPMRNLIRSVRRDGDNDGFISVAPGAPDTTPAPRVPKPPVSTRIASPSRRNDDTLDLPSASGFGKPSGSIRELAKYFGFESVHGGDYSYGKSPVARQIRKRLTSVSDPKTRGKGRPTPDYDVAEVEELIRSDKFLRSKIRRKKFAKEQVTVQEIQKHFEFSGRAAVVRTLRNAGVEPVGKQRASGSTGRGKPASVYNAEQVHTALEKRRNVWTPKEEKSYQVDHELQEKILGRGIGRRGKPRIRRGGPKNPLDGDGDGFYSPRAGMPDKTPVPARAAMQVTRRLMTGGIPDADPEIDAMTDTELKAHINKIKDPAEKRILAAQRSRKFTEAIKRARERGKGVQDLQRRQKRWGAFYDKLPRLQDGHVFALRRGEIRRTEAVGYRTYRSIVELDDDAFSGATPNERAMNIAVAASKKIEESVVKKHGKLQTTTEAKQALNNAFPNLEWDSIPERDLTTPERNMIIGLLHGAGTKPKAAKRLIKLQFFSGPSTEGGNFGHGFIGYTNGEMTVKEPVMRLNSSMTLRDLPVGFGTTENSPWAFMMVSSMKRSGNYSDEDLERVLHQNVSLHEFGHLAHMDAGLSHWGIGPQETQSKSLSPELLRRSLIEIMASSTISGDSPDVQAQIKAVLDAGAANLRTARPDLSPFQIEMELRDVVFTADPTARDKFADALSVSVLWDGVDQEKRKKIREELATVSGYARSGIDADPWVQYGEGIAEAFARRESMAGTGYESLERGAESHLRDVLTKAAKQGKNDDMKETFDVSLCSGFAKIDKDGKIRPVPSPEPIKTNPSAFKKIIKALEDKKWN